MTPEWLSWGTRVALGLELDWSEEPPWRKEWRAEVRKEQERAAEQMRWEVYWHGVEGAHCVEKSTPGLSFVTDWSRVPVMFRGRLTIPLRCIPESEHLRDVKFWPLPGKPYWLRRKRI